MIAPVKPRLQLLHRCQSCGCELAPTALFFFQQTPVCRRCYEELLDAWDMEQEGYRYSQHQRDARVGAAVLGATALVALLMLLAIGRLLFSFWS